MSESKVLNIENARILFPNFSGKGSQFNRQGDRNFCVIIDSEEVALSLRKDGWNIRQFPTNNDGEPGDFYLQIKVSYKVVPPKVYMISGKKKILLDEESINTLDFAEIRSADVSITPYDWNVNGKTGRKAYLKTMYVVIEQDAFASKYAEEEYPGEEPF